MQCYTSRKQRVFIDSLTLEASIGINPRERAKSQPLVISLWLDVTLNTSGGTCAFVPLHAETDSWNEIVCYEAISLALKKLIQKKHINLIEDLAEKILHLCFSDMRIQSVKVRIDKPDALEDAKTAGIEVEAVRDPQI